MLLKKYEIKNRNIPLLIITGTIGGMLFFLPILALYYKQNLFSVTNVAIIFAIEAIAITLFEVPTGAIADIFGRKKTIILAHLTAIIAVIFLYFGNGMEMFAIYAILNALAMSLNSGTNSALIYDTLKEEKKENHYKKVIGTISAFWPLGAVIGSIGGGYMASVSLSFPILLTFVPLTIAFILTFFLKEPTYEKDNNKNIFSHILKSGIEITKNKQILILFASSLVFYSFVESTHLLKPIFFEFKEIPIIYFGYMFGLTFGLSSLGHYFSHDISTKIGNKKTIILSSFTSFLFLFLATLVFGIGAGILITISSLSFGIRNPVVNHMINIEIQSKNRATIMSINNMISNIGFMIFLPMIGYFADLYNINTSFTISSFFILISIIIVVFLKEKN